MLTKIQIMYEELNRDLIKIYRKWRDGLQNVRNLDQVEIFHSEHRENFFCIIILLY